MCYGCGFSDSRCAVYFFRHGAAFRIGILIIFAKPFRGNGMVLCRDAARHVSTQNENNTINH